MAIWDLFTPREITCELTLKINEGVNPFRLYLSPSTSLEHGKFVDDPPSEIFVDNGKSTKAVSFKARNKDGSVVVGTEGTVIYESEDKVQGGNPTKFILKFNLPMVGDNGASAYIENGSNGNYDINTVQRIPTDQNYNTWKVEITQRAPNV